MKRSELIVPVTIVIHLLLINGFLAWFIPELYFNLNSILFFNATWLLSAYAIDYYPTSRKERFFTNFHKPIQLYLLFTLGYFAWFSLSATPLGSAQYHAYLLLGLFGSLFAYRILFYYTRAKYREVGGNAVKVVVIGRDRNLKKIRKVFDEPDLGYRYLGYFDNSHSKSPTYLGKVEEAFAYFKNNQVEQIFCIASRLSQPQLFNLMAFADNNLIKLKIIPDNKEIFTRAMKIELYDNVPVLNLRELPLETPYAKVVKRIFDVVFALIVIVGFLSWLSPIVYLLQRFDSNEPLFFKQKRHGVNRKVFWCYKFRSMATTADADTKMMTKNDKRVTKLGRILRKTSIDELPQFYNVLLGNMSVVGPRPHMEVHTEKYQTSVDKYLVRHFVKPGITGLAQVRGYRGEIVEQSDIINRTRLDIFYVEKWSLRLDLKIIYFTVVNAVKGEEKAY
ncbi:exopolysaccharide biosynthesis polyprenyl glycosylphosphotransferase [Leeuwenhoekiella blandensis]|uniref:Glycosyltransferase n=1 Tax=Leeuwenhoekiella blandensis (strain CECT 7118 / CCUG 51940 / KCTC 22103 / MED217) TaxID=398720 RepID=A3XR86_LEEBM|nr:exopolysaccharide biosynthesis polyprenyl glycosylphosphotransferase [Leeuwenhoekiella blandensis]EAQ47938.1 glycosyltransferase [Leeuwenhoekiella blandensis MED217]